MGSDSKQRVEALMDADVCASLDTLRVDRLLAVMEGQADQIEMSAARVGWGNVASEMTLARRHLLAARVALMRAEKQKGES